MARDLPDAVVQDMLKANPEFVYLTLIKVEHGQLADPLYLVNNTENITSSVIDPSTEHLAFPFEFVLPGDSADEPIGQATIEFANIDLRLVNIARAVTEEPDFTFAVVASTDYNSAVVKPTKMKLTDFSWTQETVSGTISPTDLLHTTAPNKSWTPYVSPGLFN